MFLCVNILYIRVKPHLKVCLSSGSNGADLRAKNDAQRIILVMFLGGCTFSEISALRFLGRERGNQGLNAERDF